MLGDMELSVTFDAFELTLGEDFLEHDPDVLLHLDELDNFEFFLYLVNSLVEHPCLLLTLA